MEALQKTETDPTIHHGDSAELKLYIDGTHYYSGTAVCRETRVVAGNADVKRITYSFDGNDLTAGIAFA